MKPIFTFLLIMAAFLVGCDRQSDAQCADNLRRMLDTTPTARQVIETRIAAKREHDGYLYWGATNGRADWQYRFATNELFQEVPELLATNVGYLDSQTNLARFWLQKSADQDYQPAIQLLKQLK